MYHKYSEYIRKIQLRHLFFGTVATLNYNKKFKFANFRPKMCHTKTRKRAFSDRRQNKTHTPVPRLRQHALHRQRQHHDHQGNAPQRQVAALPGHRGIQRTGALQIKQEEEPQGTIYDIPGNAPDKHFGTSVQMRIVSGKEQHEQRSEMQHHTQPGIPARQRQPVGAPAKPHSTQTGSATPAAGIRNIKAVPPPSRHEPETNCMSSPNAHSPIRETT